MKRFSILVLAFTLGVACSSENEEDLQEAPCDTSSVTYSSEVQAILASNCTSAGCHSGPNGIGGLDLNTYASAKRIADDGALVNRITGNGNIMPPAGPMSSCDIEKIRAWVNDGAANN